MTEGEEEDGNDTGVEVAEYSTHVRVVHEIGPEFLWKEFTGEVEREAEKSRREPAEDKNNRETQVIPHQSNSTVRSWPEEILGKEV